jgi:hypothetical protein
LESDQVASRHKSTEVIEAAARQVSRVDSADCVGLGQTGWVALGSVMERNKPGQGGPRYQWSRRVAGKTVTVALSKEQFEWLKAAIANQRETTKNGPPRFTAYVEALAEYVPP